MQIAFAFYVCVIQGFAPTWHFYTIRDRLVGILLGNVVITLVFHYVWPVRARRRRCGASLASALRAMARLATVGSRATTRRTVVARDRACAQAASVDLRGRAAVARMTRRSSWRRSR